ncbi:MAG: hypothetical protein ABTQ26_00345 [Azonexus sp.]
MTWLLTNSGKHFDLVDPQPDMINLLDIAHGLSNECRYAGQCKYFYSVAQHSVLTSQIVPPEFALEGLLHDAAEAYLKDIPRPLKQLLPDYRAIEHRVESVIRDHFGLPGAQSYLINEADRVLLATERRDLMPEDAIEWPVLYGITALDRQIRAVNNHRAKALFLSRLVEIIQS